MKICITSFGNNLDAELDSRFGRAKNFILIDMNNNENFEVISNEQNLNSSNGAGIQSAQNVVNSKANVVITGNCGPKAFAVLNAANIQVFLSEKSTVKEAFEKYKNNKLKTLDAANVEGHWL